MPAKLCRPPRSTNEGFGEWPQQRASQLRTPKLFVRDRARFSCSFQQLPVAGWLSSQSMVDHHIGRWACGMENVGSGSGTCGLGGSTASGSLVLCAARQYWSRRRHAWAVLNLRCGSTPWRCAGGHGVTQLCARRQQVVFDVVAGRQHHNSRCWC